MKLLIHTPPYPAFCLMLYVAYQELFIKKFKYVVLVVFTLLGLNACSERQEALTPAQVRQIETQIQQSFDALVAASEALDTERYFALIDADKFVGLNADGSNWNSFADLKALIEPGFNAVAKIESLTFSNVRISVIDANTAILVNQYQQTVLLKDGTTHSGAGGGTQVWSKASGEWLLVSISASGE